MIPSDRLSRRALTAGIAATCASMMMRRPTSVWAADAPVTAADDAAVRGRGRAFLVGLFDPALDLLPEFAGSHTYWLYHDNYLAAKVLEATHPKLAAKIHAAIAREGVDHSGKIEILFGEAKHPLPLHHYQLRDVRRVGDKLIRTEVVTDQVFAGWERYADLLLFTALAEWTLGKRESAKRRRDQAMAMWDGRGFNDAVTQATHQYATYKLALAMIAARRIEPAAKLPAGLAPQLMRMQAPSGGWYTDYRPDGSHRGTANVETTCLALLAIK